MNEMVWIDRYEVLSAWFAKGTDQHIEVNTWYTISKDYLSQAQTTQCYAKRLYECVEQQIRLEGRLGDDMPILDQHKEPETIVYDWNNRKRIEE